MNSLADNYLDHRLDDTVIELLTLIITFPLFLPYSNSFKPFGHSYKPFRMSFVYLSLPSDISWDSSIIAEGNSLA